MSAQCTVIVSESTDTKHKIGVAPTLPFCDGGRTSPPLDLALNRVNIVAITATLALRVGVTGQTGHHVPPGKA